MKSSDLWAACNDSVPWFLKEAGTSDAQKSTGSDKLMEKRSEQKSFSIHFIYSKTLVCCMELWQAPKLFIFPWRSRIIKKSVLFYFASFREEDFLFFFLVSIIFSNLCLYSVWH